MVDVNHPKVQRILHSKALAHLATVGPKGEPQSSPVWFLWDGTHIKLTHTTERQKYRNIQHDPRVSISIVDPDTSYTYAEFRGVVERIEQDPQRDFYNTLVERYQGRSRFRDDPRVIFYVSVDHIVGQDL